MSRASFAALRLISGDGFADMHFEVEAKSSEDFYAWLGQARGTGDGLTPDAISSFQQSVVPAPFTFRAVETDCSSKILDQTLPPGPGPSPRPIRPRRRDRGLACSAN